MAHPGHRRRNAGLRQSFRTHRTAERTPEPPSLSAICPNEQTRVAILRWRSVIDQPLYVYFIQAEDGGPVKIGQALNPISRVAELQCGNPARLVIRAVLLATIDTERTLHSTWDAAHVRGEWFGNGYEDVILALAADAQDLQVDQHCRGLSPLEVAEVCTVGIRYPQAAA